MILAAGRGERMMPLTASLPKPLLPVGRTTLIERHIERLAAAGVTSIVVNTHYLADKLTSALGDEQFGVPIQYSHETSLLETAGGIQAALPLLGDKPFVLVNGDLYTDFDFAELVVKGEHPQLVMVPNPTHHPDGDFGIAADGLLTEEGPRYTYAGIACYSAAFFEGMKPGKLMLRSLFDEAIQRRALKGQLFSGVWTDVGTPERYGTLKAELDQATPGL